MTSNEVRRRARGFGLCCFFGLASLVGHGSGSSAEESGRQPTRLALQILWDRPLPAELGPAVDVRWATDSSIFLALPQKGVVEVALEPIGTRLRELIPGLAKGGLWSTHLLGTSQSHLVAAAALGALTWRRLNDPLQKSFTDFDAFEDMDVGDSRVCVLGARRDEKGDFAPEGAVAWLGSLDKDLEDLKPIVFDYQGPGAASLNACGGFRIGAVRFMRHGSLVVVPGFQPGLYFFANTGRLSRVADSAVLGLDTDCRGFTDAVIGQRSINLAARYAWINQHQSLDEILPLSEGSPGFVVRRSAKGRVFWRLKILHEDGAVSEWEIPLPPQSEYSHVRGDVRGGNVVFLIEAFDGRALRYDPPHLVLARLPSPKNAGDSREGPINQQAIR